jgi:hypothetical protein
VGSERSFWKVGTLNAEGESKDTSSFLMGFPDIKASAKLYAQTHESIGFNCNNLTVKFARSHLMEQLHLPETGKNAQSTDRKARLI